MSGFMRWLTSFIFIGLSALSVVAFAYDDDLPELPSPINATEVTRVVDRVIEQHRADEVVRLAHHRNWLSDEPASLLAPPIRMLNNGKDLTEARLELIQGAQRSIYFTTFHISNDDASKRIYDALC